MKIIEIIVEHGSTPAGTLHPDHHAGMGRVAKSRDVGGYDRVYHQNRLMMATALADGHSTKAVDMPEASWVEKYNTHHPYTEEENNMIKAAMKTIPTDHKVISNDAKSREAKEVNRTSPVPVKKKNKYGV
jgi:ribonuclease BN (tRNA processing enzyme)